MKPVFAFTPVEHVWNQLALTWGIQPVLVPMVGHTDEMTSQVDRSLLEMDLVDDGDLVVIRKGDTANNGEIVVALVMGEEATLKRLRKRGASIALEPANRNYETRILGPDQVQVQGKLVGLIRRYH